MIERLLIVAALALAVALIWAGVRAWRAWSLRRIAAESPFTGIVAPGRPAVVSFSTPGCAECRTRQAPALKRLATEFGEQVAVHSLLAPEHPELVDRLGILTVPATVIVDANGVARQVNLGFTDAAKLAAQVNEFAPPQHGAYSGGLALQ